MKKTYIIPATEISLGVAGEMIASSITNVEGDSSLGLGTGDVPANADVKESNDSFWDGEW